MTTRNSLNLTRRGFMKLGGTAAAVAASLESRRLVAMEPVSYTHLTLPTILLV